MALIYFNTILFKPLHSYNVSALKGPSSGSTDTFRELGQRKPYFVDTAHKLYQNSPRTAPFGLRHVGV